MYDGEVMQPGRDGEMSVKDALGDCAKDGGGLSGGGEGCGVEVLDDVVDELDGEAGEGHGDGGRKKGRGR